MKKIILATLVAVTGIIGCQSSEDESATTTATPAPAVTTNQVTVADTSMGKYSNPNITQVPAPPSVTNVTPPPIPIGVAPKLNPAHGLPGHRCDLAVGAPLPQGSAAVAAPPPPPVQMKVPPPPVAPAMSNPTPAIGKNLNPAHGQPGHRCDIAVGAPLPQGGGPSATAAATAAPQPVQMTVPPPQAPPVLRAATPASGKMVNPAHGQPGHRCDIAVGAPLN